MKELIKEIYGRIFFMIFKLFPLKNKVVFCSFWGENCSDNPKYISDELLKEKPNLKQIWIIRKNTEIEKKPNIKYVNWGSLKMIYELVTAKVWVDNHTKPIWISKRKKQFYIETWHGGLGMKKIESDLGKKLEPKSKKQIMHNSNMANLFISNSNFLTQIYKRAFWYNGEILECGFPKNDIFFAEKERLENIKNKVYKYFNIPNNKKIILYAPTYRKDLSLEYYDIEYKELINTLNEKFKEDFICMVRLHPRMKNMSEKMGINDKDIIDGSKYNDMQELIIASEIFITDYSSGIFDFALQYKPGFIYAKDIEKYNEERGLYFDLGILPFPLSKTNQELRESIEKFDYSLYKKNLDKYFNLEEVGLKENGKASKKIVEIILQHIK